MSQTNAIYADYQATTPVDPRVIEKMGPFWRESFGNPHSGSHARGWQAEQAVQEAASSVAGLIGADSDEIIFTSGATEANNLALLGLARRARPDRNRILVSAIEHKCVLETARSLAMRGGFAIEEVAVDGEGFVDLDCLEKQLDDNVLLVSVMAVNNEIGTIQNLPAIAGIVAPWGAPLHCDAAQAPCAMDVSTITTHANLVSLSGHKMYGPQGIGALYIRRQLQERIEPLIYGGGQQNGLRSGTVPLPLCVGFGASAQLLSYGTDCSERDRIGCRRDRFVEILGLGGAPVTINGPAMPHRHPGNANLRFDGFDALDILGVMQPRLAAATGAACATGIPMPSHVLRAIGLSAAECDASIRFSFGRFTTDDEVEDAAKMVMTALDVLNEAMRGQPHDTL